MFTNEQMARMYERDPYWTKLAMSAMTSPPDPQPDDEKEEAECEECGEPYSDCGCVPCDECDEYPGDCECVPKTPPPPIQASPDVHMAAPTRVETSALFPRIVGPTDEGKCYLCARKTNTRYERSSTDHLPVCPHCVDSVLGFDIEQDGHLCKRPEEKL